MKPVLTVALGLVLAACVSTACTGSAEGVAEAVTGPGSLPPSQSGAGSPPSCVGDPGLVWTHISDDGTSNLMQLACDGTARALTQTPAEEGGSEVPRWGSCEAIYFDGDHAGSIRLFRLMAATGEIQQLTRTSGVEFSPVVTADLKRLVFEHAASDGRGDGVFVGPNHPLATVAAWRRLTLNPAAAQGGFDAPTDVSPDGMTVLFERNLGGKAGAVRSAVFTVGIDGRALRRLSPWAMNAYGPRFSPDGHRIAFSDNGDNFSDTLSANVWVMDRDGSHLTRVTESSMGGHAYGPAWGPRGDSLFYVRVTPGTSGTSIVEQDLASGASAVRYRGREGQENHLDWEACKEAVTG